MNTFIHRYLNNLPSDTEKIEIVNLNLTFIPDLSRFVKLRYLYCSNNKLTSLPPLNPTLISLSCSHNELTSLPPLSANLMYLSCSHNKLTSLPPLNKKLTTLDCSHNQLTRLPELNEKLKTLHCSHNQLTDLPILNTSLKQIVFGNNVIYDVINSDDIHIIKIILQKLHKFKNFYYLLRLKQKFRNWLWERVREPKAMNKYSPEALINLLDSTTIIDDDDHLFSLVLHNW